MWQYIIQTTINDTLNNKKIKNTQLDHLLEYIFYGSSFYVLVCV